MRKFGHSPPHHDELGRTDKVVTWKLYDRVCAEERYRDEYLLKAFSLLIQKMIQIPKRWGKLWKWKTKLRIEVGQCEIWWAWSMEGSLFIFIFSGLLALLMY